MNKQCILLVMLHSEKLIKARLQGTIYDHYDLDSDGAVLFFISDYDFPEVNKYQLAELLSALMKDIKENK